VGGAGQSTSTVEDVRRLAGRPRTFGDAIAVFAHRRARRRSLGYGVFDGASVAAKMLLMILTMANKQSETN